MNWIGKIPWAKWACAALAATLFLSSAPLLAGDRKYDRRQAYERHHPKKGYYVRRGWAPYRHHHHQRFNRYYGPYFRDYYPYRGGYYVKPGRYYHQQQERWHQGGAAVYHNGNLTIILRGYID